MAKVDLVLARKMQDKAAELEKVARDIRRWLFDLGMFCDECGETEPTSHFYPMWACGPNSVSGLLCNDCEAALRQLVSGTSEDGVPAHEGCDGA